MFKTVPTGHPELAKAKEDHEWNRSTVESTVRSWYKYMPLRGSDARGVHETWDARFASLPPQGDTAQLPDALKLKWEDLPKFRPVRGGGDVAGDHEIGDVGAEMENPPINPVTGHGRSAADVQEDLRKYQARVRHADNLHTPIFQADYIFLRTSAGAVALHRVVHGACLHDATSLHITFTATEYIHAPQAGHAGFWGHFTPKPNLAYDPHDRAKGGMFVRHTQVQRAAVVVYNVITFVRKGADGTKDLYVSAESLRELAAATGDVAGMPTSTPSTHTGRSAAGAGGRGRAGSRAGGRSVGRGDGGRAGGRRGDGGRDGGSADGRAGGRASGRAGGRAGGQDTRSQADANSSSSSDDGDSRRADGQAGSRADGRAGGCAGSQDARSRADDNLSPTVEVAGHEKGAATANSATANPGSAATIAIATVTAGAAPSNAATALASAQQHYMYVEGQGSSSDEAGIDDFTSPPTRPSNRIGQVMEIQGCAPDTCDYICTQCDWEACTVVADDGTFCDVKLHADGTECSGVNSRRFLRYPPSSKRARRS